MPATLSPAGSSVYTRVSERRGYTVKAGARTRDRLRRGIDIRSTITASWCSGCKNPFSKCTCWRPVEAKCICPHCHGAGCNLCTG